ncbi:hypothetical protein Cgig2_006593 [Carnegiea gigantea]|uniref:Uncharacterized protein n=1 Tax=Carnegiea gigantea TaxID=171969 RepID=A0A9Q1KPZ3_9CARY|nr:hypothetical protein Cgig2_006593 [Carnegiea gigantea]
MFILHCLTDNAFALRHPRDFISQYFATKKEITPAKKIKEAKETESSYYGYGEGNAASFSSPDCMNSARTTPVYSIRCFSRWKMPLFESLDRFATNIASIPRPQGYSLNVELWRLSGNGTTVPDTNLRADPRDRLAKCATALTGEAKIHRTGLIDPTGSAAKEAYSKYKPTAKDLVYEYKPMFEDYALWAWWWFNRVPIVSHIARRMLSNATFWAERGYPLVDYMPVVPVQRISQVLTVTERDAMAAAY